MATRMLRTFARVFLGFVLSCLTAGLVTVLFVNSPAEIFSLPGDAMPERAGQSLELALLTATHSAIFAFAFTLIAAGIGEWFSIKSLPFYLLVGTAIAMLGYSAQVSSEVAGQPTVLNNYALKAFLTAGFLAGFVYWLAAGQHAGGSDQADGDGLTFKRPDKPRWSEHQRMKRADSDEPTTGTSAKADAHYRMSEVEVTQPSGRSVRKSDPATSVPATRPPALAGKPPGLKARS